MMKHDEAVHRGPLHPMSKCASIVHWQPVSNGSTTSSRLADGLQNRWRRPVRRTDLVNLLQLSIPTLESPRAGISCNPCASREVSRAFLGLAGPSLFAA